MDEDIQDAADTILGAIAESKDQPELKALGLAGVALLVGALTDLRRIANALESLAKHSTGRTGI